MRNKLLAMALLPLLVVFPLLVLALALWGSTAYDKLLITKVRSDLAVAHGYFDQVLTEVGAGTQGVADSRSLFSALESASPKLVSSAGRYMRAEVPLNAAGSVQ